MKPTLLGVLVAMATVLVLLPVEPAVAHTVRWRTTASFGLTASGGEAALGTVSSPRAGCVKNRKVKLFLVRPGRDRQVGVDRRTGVPTGSGDGYFVIPTDLRPGRRYYAVVVKKNLGSGRHRHICKQYRTSALQYVG